MENLNEKFNSLSLKMNYFILRTESLNKKVSEIFYTFAYIYTFYICIYIHVS